jgi:hypothetical protein
LLLRHRWHGDCDHDRTRTWAHDRAAELVGRRRIGDRTIPTADDGQAITDSTADMIAGDVRNAIQSGSSPTARRCCTD